MIQIFLFLAITGNFLHFYFKIKSDPEPQIDIYSLIKGAMVLMLVFNLPIKILQTKLTVEMAVVDSLVNSTVYAYVMFAALVFCDSFNLTTQDRNLFYTRKIGVSVVMFVVAFLRCYADQTSNVKRYQNGF